MEFAGQAEGLESSFRFSEVFAAQHELHEQHAHDDVRKCDEQQGVGVFGVFHDIDLVQHRQNLTDDYSQIHHEKAGDILPVAPVVTYYAPITQEDECRLHQEGGGEHSRQEGTTQDVAVHHTVIQTGVHHHSDGEQHHRLTRAVPVFQGDSRDGDAESRPHHPVEGIAVYRDLQHVIVDRTDGDHRYDRDQGDGRMDFEIQSAHSTTTFFLTSATMIFPGPPIRYMMLWSFSSILTLLTVNLSARVSVPSL